MEAFLLLKQDFSRNPTLVSFSALPKFPPCHQLLSFNNELMILPFGLSFLVEIARSSCPTPIDFFRWRLKNIHQFFGYHRRSFNRHQRSLFKIIPTITPMRPSILAFVFVDLSIGSRIYTQEELVEAIKNFLSSSASTSKSPLPLYRTRNAKLPHLQNQPLGFLKKGKQMLARIPEGDSSSYMLTIYSWLLRYNYSSNATRSFWNKKILSFP